MSLSLHKLKKKLILNKNAQGNLIVIFLAGVMGITIVSSLTTLYLSTKKSIDDVDNQLEGMTIASNEWQRLEHMDFDEIKANKENYKTPYNVGDKFKVSVNLGEQGYFDNNKCNSLEGSYSSEEADCFKDSSVTVYNEEGKAIYTTRSLPLSSGASESGTYNQMLILTEDQIFTAQENGWYKITAIGGGGGGNGGNCLVSRVNFGGADAWAWVGGGGGGGEGGKYIGYHHLKKGETVNITIGKGGSGADGLISYTGSCYETSGSKGGNTIIGINGTSYIAYGGEGGFGSCTGGQGGEGGAGTIKGANGITTSPFVDYASGHAAGPGGKGGGNGYGEGGMGGRGYLKNYTCIKDSDYHGENGKNGAVFIEYYSKKIS